MLQLLFLLACATFVASDDSAGNATVADNSTSAENSTVIRAKRADLGTCAWGNVAVSLCFPAKPPANPVPYCGGQYKCDQAANKCCLPGAPVVPTINLPRLLEPKCTVGEPPNHDNEKEFDPDGAGICNYRDGQNKCTDYCRKRYGTTENIDSRCVDRADGVQECTCINRCCIQGCWGDPHCYTCDGAKFGYQGLEKYWVIKPCQKYTQIPNFEILQTNKVWGAGPMAVLNTSELVIPEWNTKIEIITPQTAVAAVGAINGGWIIRVNGTAIANPVYSWKALSGYTANTIEIGFADTTKNQLFIQTSFGVRMLIAVHFSGNAIYSDLTVNTPRIADIKGKMCGLIGRWTGNVDDDGVDSTGKKQPLDDKFSCAFGNSWRVPATGLSLTCTPVENTKLITTVTTVITKIEITTVTYIRTVCTQNLALFATCAKQLGLPVLNVDDCVTDSLLIGEVTQMLNYVQALLLKYQVICRVQITFIQPPLPTPPPTPAPTPGALTTPTAILPPRVPPTCDFGEFDSEKTGQCNGDDGDYKCLKFCKTTLGADMIDAVCVNREGGKKECICRAKCCNQGCQGDPHCWTCDGATFSYQGLKEHYLLMMWKKYTTFPNFEIRQINKVWVNGPMAVLNISRLYIAEWDLKIEVRTPVSIVDKYTVVINDKVVDVLNGFRWTKSVDFRLRFVDFSFVDAQRTQLRLVTSFGLRITISVHIWGQYTYSDISVDFPRHPDLKDKIAGLLGHWNGDIGDEGVDFNGVKQVIDGTFSVIFGDSWIVKELPKPKPDESKTENIVQVGGCLKDLGRPPLIVQDCVIDALTIPEVDQRTKYIQAMVGKFATSCNISIPFIETKCCMKSLSGLYRLYSLQSDSYVFTTDSTEAIQITGLSPINPYRFEGSPGEVALDPNDCGCNLQPVYRLYRYISGKEDHLYTTDLSEANSLVNSKKYYRQGTPFYCAPVAGKCGADLPLRRYSVGVGHFYTTSESEANANVIPKGGKFENILCYIWRTGGTINNDDVAAQLAKRQSGISLAEIALLRQNNVGFTDVDVQKMIAQ